MPKTSRRADVRATAARLFRERGYSSATMDLLADEVGLNKGTLYHYYPAKSAILYELLSDQLDVTVALLAEVPAVGSATERLRTFVRLQVEHVASTPDELVVFFQELPWIDKNLAPEQAADLRARIEVYRTFTRGLLDEGIAAGEFRPLDVDLIQYSIVGILAYIPVWFRARSGRTKASLVSELADFVMSGVALAPTPATGREQPPAGNNHRPGITTTMEHRRGQDNHDGASLWLRSRRPEPPTGSPASDQLRPVRLGSRAGRAHPPSAELNKCCPAAPGSHSSFFSK